jgi:hypothetical protein
VDSNSLAMNQLLLLFFQRSEMAIICDLLSVARPRGDLGGLNPPPPPPHLPPGRLLGFIKTAYIFLGGSRVTPFDYHYNFVLSLLLLLCRPKVTL